MPASAVQVWLPIDWLITGAAGGKGLLLIGLSSTNTILPPPKFLHFKPVFISVREVQGVGCEKKWPGEDRKWEDRPGVYLLPRCCPEPTGPLVTLIFSVGWWLLWWLLPQEVLTHPSPLSPSRSLWIWSGLVYTLKISQTHTLSYILPPTGTWHLMPQMRPGQASRGSACACGKHRKRYGRHFSLLYLVRLWPVTAQGTPLTPELGFYPGLSIPMTNLWHGPPMLLRQPWSHSEPFSPLILNSTSRGRWPVSPPPVAPPPEVPLCALSGFPRWL